MKTYVSPEMDLVLLDVENVITASVGDGKEPVVGKDAEVGSGSIFG